MIRNRKKNISSCVFWFRNAFCAHLYIDIIAVHETLTLRKENKIAQTQWVPHGSVLGARRFAGFVQT